MANTKKERFIVTTRWRKLSEEEQIAEVQQAMQERHTNKTAARKLGTTPGTVAGIRWRNNIASQNVRLTPVPQPKPPAPPSLPKPQAPKPKSEPKMEPIRKRGEVMEVEGPKPKMAPPGKECSYRDEAGRQCAYLPMEAEPSRKLDFDRCRLHQRKK